MSYARIILTIFAFSAASAHAEKMPVVRCGVGATVSAVTPRLTVRVTDVLPIPGGKASDCGVGTGKTYTAKNPRHLALKPGDGVTATSVFDASRECVPDEKGHRPPAPEPSLEIDSRN